MPQRALLMINRKSRSGTIGAEAAIERLAGRGLNFVQEDVDRPEQIAEAIRRHRAEVDCVIVGGGDGSFNVAAPALASTGLPLGVLPLGTANDLARTLHIPGTIEEAVDVIAEGRLHRIDLGMVNDRCFFNVANIGLGVRVTRQLSSELKQRWGVASYARCLVAAFRKFRPFHADIICDGRKSRVRTIQVAVGNGRHYGGGMTVAEEARIDDHKFFLYSLAPLPLWDLVRMAPAFRTGQFDERHPVDLEHGRTVEIHTRRRMPVSADGEIVTSTPARFKILPQAISVFVPASYLEYRQEAIYAA